MAKCKHSCFLYHHTLSSQITWLPNRMRSTLCKRCSAMESSRAASPRQWTWKTLPNNPLLNSPMTALTTCNHSLLTHARTLLARAWIAIPCSMLPDGAAETMATHLPGQPLPGNSFTQSGYDCSEVMQLKRQTC